MDEQLNKLLLEISPKVYALYETVKLMDNHFVPLNSFSIVQRAKELGITVERDLLGNITGHTIPTLGRAAPRFRSEDANKAPDPRLGIPRTVGKKIAHPNITRRNDERKI